ncbi:MAG: BON domain-containing protein [Candidatus Omnitrophica bacterium]|nr:BON domain-containing protein [Candidatus Omnitrophota bacterium]
MMNNNKILGRLILVALITVFFAGFGFATAAEVSDSEITAAIETDLMVSEKVSSHLIDVSTVDGIVTLSGSVDNLLSRDQAIKIAESIKGVRSVINRIAVKPLKRSDEEIERDVRNALLLDPVTEVFEIDVEVNDGVVTLSGAVDSWAEKQIVSRVVKGVKGVREVDNGARIKYGIDRSDREIKTEIKRRLASDPYVNEEWLKVSVQEGEVSVSGTVGSVFEKDRVYSDSWVAGVKSVETDALKVEAWPADEMKRKKRGEDKSDRKIEEAIKDALLYDPRTVSFRINVEVDDGFATLAGTVDNLKAKKAAEKTAKNTVSVWGVTNLIRVRPAETVSDSEIADRVNAALFWNPLLERYDISVYVNNGKVFLNGAVYTYYEKYEAEDVVSRIVGVVDVKNNLSVLPEWYWKSDRQIKKDVKAQIFWSLFVDSDDIDVSVEEGTVTLSGKVNSLHKLNAAVRNAFEGGAKTVRSKLEIEGVEDFYPVYHHYEYLSLW